MYRPQLILICKATVCRMFGDFSWISVSVSHSFPLTNLSFASLSPAVQARGPLPKTMKRHLRRLRKDSKLFNSRGRADGVFADLPNLSIAMKSRWSTEETGLSNLGRPLLLTRKASYLGKARVCTNSNPSWRAYWPRI